MVFATHGGKLVANLADLPRLRRPVRRCRRQRVYVICGEGVVEVFAQRGGTYQSIGRVPTVSGARTSWFSADADRLYVGVRASGSGAAALWIFRPVPDAPALSPCARDCSPLLWAGEALAYRPFDGPMPLSPSPGWSRSSWDRREYQQIGPNRTLSAPNVIFNYGLADRWELVLQGGLARGLEPDASGVALTGNQLLLKGVLREGTLQEKTGASIATEFGFLLPDISAAIRAALALLALRYRLAALAGVHGPLQRRGGADPPAERRHRLQHHRRGTEPLDRAGRWPSCSTSTTTAAPRPARRWSVHLAIAITSRSTLACAAAGSTTSPERGAGRTATFGFAAASIIDEATSRRRA